MMNNRIRVALVWGVLLLSLATAFVIPGRVPVQVTKRESVVLRPVRTYPGHRFTDWSNSPSVPLFFSADSTSSGEDGSSVPPSTGSESVISVEQEMKKIQNGRMTAKQIKAELEELGVSYKGLLEKVEYVRALAEARISTAGSSITDDAPTAEQPEPEVGASSSTSEASETKHDPEVPAAGSSVTDDAPTAEQPEPEVGASSSTSEASETKHDPEVSDIPDAGSERAVDNDIGTDMPTERGSTDIPGDEEDNEDKQVESAEDREGASASEKSGAPSVNKNSSGTEDGPDEHGSASPAGDSREEESVAQEGAPAVSPPPGVDSTEVPVEASSSSNPGNDEPATTPPESPELEPSAADDPVAPPDSVNQEISRILDARMTAKQIKTELDSLGVSYRDLLEKSEFVQRLAEVRANPDKFEAEGDSATGEAVDGQETGEKTSEVEVDVAGGEASVGSAPPQDETVESREDVPSPAPAPQTPAPEPSIAEETDGNDGGRTSSEASAGDIDEVKAMRISQIKKELDERGVSYKGLFEKFEFVDLLVDARARGVTGPASTSDANQGNQPGDTRSGQAGSKSNEFDPSYKDVEMKKMKDDTDGQEREDGGPSSGAAPGAGGPGGFDIGSILSGLGGMGGAGGGGASGGAPGGAGGFDMNSILSALGGMGGAGGGAPGSGMPGMGNIGDMLGKVMNNPKLMAAFQKAQQNPKIMEAVQDVSKNGLGAAAKYRDDPEVLSVIEELKSLF